MKNKNKQTKFPVARIKKIMQKDEEVGKVAQATPVVISKALELFLGLIVEQSSNITVERGSKKVEAYHLKHAVEHTEMLDFLKELVQDIPDPSAGGTIDLEAEAAESRKKRGKGKRAAAAAAASADPNAPPKRRRKKKNGDAAGSDAEDDAPAPPTKKGRKAAPVKAKREEEADEDTEMQDDADEYDDDDDGARPPPPTGTTAASTSYRLRSPGSDYED